MPKIALSLASGLGIDAGWMTVLAVTAVPGALTVTVKERLRLLLLGWPLLIVTVTVMTAVPTALAMGLNRMLPLLSGLV